MRAPAATRAISIALLLAGGSVFAQAPGVEADRVSRRCTGATLNTDPSAPCQDDVLRDRADAPKVVGLPGVPAVPGATGAAGTGTLPGAPVTSGNTIPGASPTSGGTTPGTSIPQPTAGSPSTSGGITPGTSGTSSGSTPGAPVTSGGTIPGAPVTSGGTTSPRSSAKR